MNKAVFFCFLSLTGLFLLFLWQQVSFHDGKLHLVFCNVGQGDAILLKSPSGSLILFDAGPDEKIDACLSRHLPFWQRKLSLALLSHPHLDHFFGFFRVLKNYQIAQFATENLVNSSEVFQKLKKSLAEKKIETRFLAFGDSFSLEDGLRLRVLGPKNQFLAATSPGGKIGENSEFGSLVIVVSYENFHALLTGDTQARELRDALEAFGSQIDILQVPHHGSKTGLTNEILEGVKPGLAVISVGRNKYGHPAKSTLSLLANYRISLLRTDQAGDIEIISDGTTWKVAYSK